jgi:NAD(P)-dependent dehydrogenase (short-subunit alcohol dehydrogenase family)
VSEVAVQRVLITGANSGIGRAAAIRFAASGHRVLAAMRDTGKAEKLLGLASDAGAPVELLQLDVTDDESVRRGIEQAGRVDVLVNNAGIGWNATVEDIDVSAAKVVFETNFWGVIRCTQKVLPQMRERGEGTIINVSSIAGRVALLAQPVYASSKWALECLSENLAQEVAPFGIRVIVVEPGVTRTAILPKNLQYPKPTAYEPAYRRLLQFYSAGIEANVRPEVVAEVILRAFTDQEPRLRYACAWGSAELLDGRERMSDQEWVDLGTAESDEDYYGEFRRLFGLDLRSSGEEGPGS